VEEHVIGKLQVISWYDNVIICLLGVLCVDSCCQPNGDHNIT